MTAINRVNNRLRINHSPTKEAAVQSLDGILAAGHLVEFEVDVAGGSGVEGDVYDVPVFFFAFGADVVFEFFGPGVAFFSVGVVRFVSLLFSRGWRKREHTQQDQTYFLTKHSDSPY